MKRHEADAVLITSARQSRLEELQARQRRYLITMGIRAVLFVLAVTLLHGWVAAIAAVGAIVLPWVAVVAANGGPKREALRPSLYPAEGLDQARARELSPPPRTYDAERD